MSGSYLKSLQLAKQLEEKTKEAAKNRDIAEKENEALEEFLQTCKDSDVNLSATDKIRADFDAAIASKDYQSAIAYVRKAQDAAKEAYTAKIGEVGDSVETLLVLIRGASGESKSAVDLLDKSKERIVKDDFEGAMKYARNAYDAAERTLHEVFSQLFSQAQETIMQAKDIENDVTIFEDQLSRAKASLESQEYEACMDQIKEVLEGAGEDLKSQIGASISRAEELLSAGEELGADVSRVKTHAERSQNALNSLKYKEALSYAKKAEAEGESALSAKFQEMVREVRDSIKKMRNAKEDVTIPQQLLDQGQTALKEKKYIEALHALHTAHEKVHRAEFDSVLEVIAAARDRFVLAKKVGVDMTKAIMLLNTARDNLKLGKFEDAIRYANDSKKEVDTALEMFYKARDQVVELAKAVKYGTDLGVESAAPRDMLAEARKYFEAKDYEKTLETTKKGIVEVKRLTHEKTVDTINSADGAVRFGRTVGADVVEAEGILQKALDSLSKEDMAEGAKFANASKEAANAAMTRLMSDRLQSIDQFIKGYSGEAGMADAGEIITQARQNVAAYEFEKAYALLGQVTQKIEAVGQAQSDKVITAARQRIELVKSIGGDASDLEILLNRAYEAISKKVYEDASARAAEIVQNADEMLAKMMQLELSSVKDHIEEARNIGMSIEGAKTMLKEARARADEMDFAEAFRIVKETKSSLQQGIAKYDGVKGKIRRGEELMAEASRTKADVSNSARKLDIARTAFARGHLEEADGLLDEVMAEVEKSLAMYLAAKLILSSKESIELGQANSVDISSSVSLLSRAKDLMKQKNYEEALAVAKRCDREAKESISTSIIGMTKDLQRLLTDARNVGVDTLGPERLAEKAAELAKAGDFVEALRCISSAKEDINHVKSLSSQAALEIRIARTNLKDAETLDIDVGKGREFLDQAVEALTRHQYAIALELARKSAEASSEVSKSRIWDTLGKFSERIENDSSRGLDVTAARACVSDGIKAFKNGQHQDALKLAMKCEAEMDRAELQRDISARAVELARKKLQDAVAEGIRSDRLTELVEKSERLMRDANYVDAMTAAMESGDELYLIRENLDSCRIELSGTKERVERLKKIKIDTRECDEITDMAQEYLANQDFAKCRDALKRASLKSATLFEDSIQDVMEQNKQMIARAKAIGINTKACEDLLEVANTSFAEKLWDFAYQQAMACRDSCLNLISKKLSTLVADVEERMEESRRLGASVRPVEDMIQDAQSVAEAGDIGTAFQILMDADRRIGGVEDSHKKYMDLAIAAESAIENLGRFGLSKREPERLMAMADIEKEKDYDSAIELVAEALDTAKEQMEAYSPEISASLTSQSMQAGVAADLVIVLKNAGKALAKDVAIDVAGDFDVLETKEIPVLRPNSETPATIKVKPRKSGNIPIKISITSKRHFDGRLQTTSLEDSINVFQAGPPFKIGRSADTTRCISCQGRIKPGFDIVTCRCGGQLHLSCAKRTNQCPVCGQKYDF